MLVLPSTSIVLYSNLPLYIATMYCYITLYEDNEDTVLDILDFHNAQFFIHFSSFFFSKFLQF